MKLKPEQFKTGQYIKFQDRYTKKSHIVVINRLEEAFEDGDLQIWFHYEGDEAYISLDLYNEGNSFAKNIGFLDENGQEDELAQLKKTIEKQSKIIAKLKDFNSKMANQFISQDEFKTKGCDGDFDDADFKGGFIYAVKDARKIKKEAEELEND